MILNYSYLITYHQYILSHFWNNSNFLLCNYIFSFALISFAFCKASSLLASFIFASFSRVSFSLPCMSLIIVSRSFLISSPLTSSKVLRPNLKCSLDLEQLESFSKASPLSPTSATALSILLYFESIISFTNLILSAHIVIVEVYIQISLVEVNQAILA